MRIRIFGKLYTIPKAVIYSVITVMALVIIVVGSIKKNKKTIYIEPLEITPAVTNKKHEEEEENAVIVYIVGCVVNPGIYKLKENEVINTVVEMAGGLTEDADRENVNLAMRIYDGMMIKIPSVNDEDKTYIIVDSESTNKSGTISSGKVNINKADATTLCTLPGIGESTAKKIVMFRNENGEFDRIEDIMNVPGIKEGKYASIKDWITVD